MGGGENLLLLFLVQDEGNQQVLGVHPVAGGNVEFVHLAVDLGDEGGLHLHGFHDHQGLVDLDLVPFLHQDGLHGAGDGGAQVAGVVLVGLQLAVFQDLQGLVQDLLLRRMR